MQQTITINDNLFNNAAQYLGTQDLNAIIDIALREFVENHRPTQTRRRPPISIAGKAKILDNLIEPCVAAENFECLK
jgi:hypothetical protein